MVMMNVELISKEIIKPSSPTPPHLRNLKLSFLDQLAPPIYIPIILFYGYDHDLDFKESCVSLKKSLSETLTRFYPLAGTMLENFSIDCNDKGVAFLEVRISCKLEEVIKNPHANVQSLFLPIKHYNTFTQNNALLAVQFNTLDCGNVVIGVCVSHKIADGISAAMFVNSWAAVARGDEAVFPTFDASIHFPTKNIPNFSQDDRIMNENIVTKRMVFEKSHIDSFKKEGSQSKLNPPTRIEAVSSFIWRRFMAITRSKQVHAQVCMAGHAVDIRERMVPPMGTNSFGNLWQYAIAPCPIEMDKEHHVLVRELSDAINGIYCDYVKNKLQSEDGYFEFARTSMEQFSKGEMEFLNFTSWCRFRLYEVDFGWGKPIWVTRPTLPIKNVVVLMSTKDGDGIEALVNMVDHDMERFACDLEILPFLSS